MNDPDIRPLDKFDAPFNKSVELQEVTLDGGVRLLRLRIREGARFTIMDLDPLTAARWGIQMADWATDQTDIINKTEP